MTAQAPWLSVLVPVYKVEPYLEHCIRSVIDQADTGIEILLLDDASPDRSGEIARNLQQQHREQVRVFKHDTNRGLSAARNTLLSHARGDYVWFLDSDDFLLPGAVARVRKVIVDHAPDLLLCDFRVVRDAPRLKHRLRGEHHRRTFLGPSNRLLSSRAELIRGLLTARQLHSWSKIARRDIWRTTEFPEGRAFEDISVIPSLLANTRSWWHMDRPLLGYRQRSDSILATLDTHRLRDLLDAVREFHQAMATLVQADSPERFVLDYYCLRLIDLASRKTTASDDGLKDRIIEVTAQLFPDHGRNLIAACRRRGWWLRAERLRRAINRSHVGSDSP